MLPADAAVERAKDRPADPPEAESFRTYARCWHVLLTSCRDNSMPARNRGIGIAHLKVDEALAAVLVALRETH